MSKYLMGVAFIAILASCTSTTDKTNLPEQADTQTATIEIPEVSGHDTNRAKAMLYRWWSIFEAPDREQSAAWLDGLFTPGVELQMEAVEIKGFEAIKSTFTQLPSDLGRSHKLEDIKVTKLTTDRLKLEANFIYQINAIDGSIQSGRSGYIHEIVKTADGSLAFDKMTAIVADRINTPLLQPTYIDNRARSTVYQYLGITDKLDSNYLALRDILTTNAEIHGMFDPAVESHNSRKDGVLRGWEEIAPWLSTRKNTFSWVNHDIEELTVTSIQNGQINTNVTISVQAQPKKGNLISVTLPIKITMIESEGPYMRIKRIER